MYYTKLEDVWCNGVVFYRASVHILVYMTETLRWVFRMC